MTMRRGAQQLPSASVSSQRDDVLDGVQQRVLARQPDAWSRSSPTVRLVALARRLRDGHQDARSHGRGIGSPARRCPGGDHRCPRLEVRTFIWSMSANGPGRCRVRLPGGGRDRSGAHGQPGGRPSRLRPLPDRCNHQHSNPAEIPGYPFPPTQSHPQAYKGTYTRGPQGDWPVWFSFPPEGTKQDSAQRRLFIIRSEQERAGAGPHRDKSGIPPPVRAASNLARCCACWCAP
jgi:hypothetical protein